MDVVVDIRPAAGVACSKRKRADPVSMSVTFSARLVRAQSQSQRQRQAC